MDKTLLKEIAVQSKRKVESLIQATDGFTRESTREREISALVDAMNELKLKEGLILTGDHEEKVTVEGKTITIMPVYKWLLACE